MNDISYFKEQLLAKEEMLSQTTKFLTENRKELENKLAEISIINAELFDSINFASLIQKSLLPDLDVLKTYFKDASYKVFQQIGIGGDSIFIKNTNKGVVFGLFDSTGHGVPAALLSISGTLLLKELMASLEIDNPQTLLNLLNFQLQNTFNHMSSSFAHIEGIIFSFSSVNNCLTYSSAKGKSFIIKKFGEVQELNYSRKSVGDEAETNFELYNLEIQTGDKLVIYSDGLVDQFGGNNNKKYTKDRLKKFILPHINKSATELADAIENEFFTWRDGYKQTDDVSFMVIEF